MSNALAAERISPPHKVVIHVDTANKNEQHLALKSAANLLHYYGPHNVVIEIVANGPGLSLLTTKSDSEQRVSRLVLDNVRFSACANTMASIQRKTGTLPVLAQGVKIVPAGIARIIHLEEAGYSYVKP